jgi:hypothetical protein
MGLSGQRHAPAALYTRGKDPRYPLYPLYPLDKRLGGPQIFGYVRFCFRLINLQVAPKYETINSFVSLLGLITYTRESNLYQSQEPLLTP